MIEGALRSLSDRLDRIPVGNDNASAFAHLEQRVSYLLERLESSGRSAAPAISAASKKGCWIFCARSSASTPIWSRSPTATSAATARRSRWIPASSMPSSANCPTSASASRKPTAAPRNSLETVHNTLGHVVDRLAMIEGDLRAVRTAPAGRSKRTSKPPRAAMPQPNSAPPAYAPQAPRRRPMRRSRNRNCRIPPQRRSILPRHRANSTPRSRGAGCAADAAARHQRNPRAARRGTAHRDCAGAAAGSSARAGNATGGARIVAVRADCSFRERDQRNFRSCQGTGQFIELHRRRAPCRAGRRCRASQREGGKGRRKSGRKASAKVTAINSGKADGSNEPSTITSKIRSVLVGASVVVIVLGTFKMAMTLLDIGSAPECRRWKLPPIRQPPRRPPARTAPGPRCRHRRALDDLADPDRQAIQQQSARPNTLDSAQVAIPQRRRRRRPTPPTSPARSRQARRLRQARD